MWTLLCGLVFAQTDVLDPGLQLPPGQLFPPERPDVATDCDALDAIAELEAWFDVQRAEADQLAEALRQCFADLGIPESPPPATLDDLLAPYVPAPVSPPLPAVVPIADLDTCFTLIEPFIPIGTIGIVPSLGYRCPHGMTMASDALEDLAWALAECEELRDRRLCDRTLEAAEILHGYAEGAADQFVRGETFCSQANLDRGCSSN